MKFEFSNHPLDKISSDAAIVFTFQKVERPNEAKSSEGEKAYKSTDQFEELDKALGGQLQKVCDLEKFSGKRGELLTVVPNVALTPSRVVVIGLGKKEEFTVDEWRRALGAFAKHMRHKINAASVAIPQELLSMTDISLAAHALGEGLILGTYVFHKYKAQEKIEKDFTSVTISVADQSDKATIFAALERAELYTKATILARDLVNEPGNVLTPTELAALAQDIAKKNPELITCKTYDKDEIEKMGMGAFLAIARAALTPPKFIHLEYRPAGGQGNSKKKLALIGKGITFDTGGINVKPGDHMSDMKMDMAGAAAVLAVFSVIADIKPSFPVMGLIAATPNLVSATSTLPGDVAKAYNGKTIEILNTDAEGRVTMADSLSYALKQGATELIDLATLTGACMIALGPTVAGLFSNNQDIAEAVKAAAYDAGERVWELPLEKDYKSFNKSDVADISNIANTRYGGALTAALFLETFVDNKPWVHLDIAGPAFINRPSDIGPKGGTGFGVRTLLNLLTKD